MGAIFKSTYDPPSRMFTPIGFRRVLLEAFRDAGNDVIAQLEKTTRTWTHPPRFDLRITGNTLEITSNDKVFNILNVGALPHDIQPRHKKRLAFNWAGRGRYKPKSKPLSLRAYVGMAGKRVRAGDLVRPYMVRHPGLKARRWDEAVNARFADKIERSVAYKVDKLFR